MVRHWSRVIGGAALVVVLATIAAAPAGATAGGAADPADPAAPAVRPVGVVTRTFVDRTRKTPTDPVAGIPPSSQRVLPTTVYYPARGAAAAGTTTRGAKPARGRFPLVLFNHGSPGTPADYEVLLADWAAHGYVVVAPEFPISSVAGPDDVAWKDLPAQTKDARFVLDRVLDLDAGKAGIPEIDEDRLAVAGHSFGGATALSLASKCCRDDRFDAVVALAAVTETQHGPRITKPVGPILFVHARGDRAVSYAKAAATCETAGRPRWLLTVEGLRGLRAHIVPYLGEGEPSAAVVRPAIVDFLDGYVRDRRAARARLAGAGAGGDVAVMTTCRRGASTTTATTAPSTPTTTRPG